MIQPTLSPIATSRDMLDAFLGYNHNLRVSGGEFYDMKNLTSEYYPALSPRGKRGIYEYPGEGEHHPNGLLAKDALCYVDGTKLYINNKEVAGLILKDSPKQLISMGAYIIIMPDKVYVNTKDFTDMGAIEAFYPGTDGQRVNASYEMCRVDGTVYADVTIYPTAPVEPKNMQLWIDTSSTPHVLKEFSETQAIWNPIPTVYTRISAPNIAASFKQYDAVRITGMPDNNAQLSELEGKISVLYDVYRDKGSDERKEGTEDYIVVTCFLDEALTKESCLRIERTMPVMDFMIESGNRLWGCRYGENADGVIVNEIYASKLGDFKNWNCFLGVTTDSYMASCGTDGQWTGAISHLGYPIFFKENCLHKVYGNYPANYQIQATECRGVQKGCGKSLAIVNERLYYKSGNGVCVYDGSLPSEVSSALGDVRYSEAVGGSHNNRYYISMKSEVDGEWYLFVYDTTSGMWHKEDQTRVDGFCSCGGELYFIDHSDKRIKTVLGSGIKEREDVEWMAESGVIGMSLPDKKYISNMIIRMWLSIGTRIRFSIQYDSCGQWECVYSATGTHLRSFSIPIRPKRCDHFRLRMEGVGDAKIFSITKTVEQGSDV